MYSIEMPFTTDAAGNATATKTLPYPARLVRVRWEKGSLATGVDFSIKANGSAGLATALGVSASTLDRTLMTISNADVSAWYAPNADSVIDSTVTLTVTAGGNTVKGAAILYLDQDVSDSSLITSALPAGTNNIGDVDILTIAKPTAIAFGNKTVGAAGTRVPLVASSTPLVAGVVEIKALWGNTGRIYVGDVTVASTKGHWLAVGESVVLYIDDLNRIYLDAEISTNGVTFIGT